MQLCVVLLALVGLSVAAPQAAWPYPDSLLPYRYGYPGQGQYKYLPELEDDEEVGPYLSSHKTGRQDLVVGEGAKPGVVTEAPSVTVVETGSVAPVKENEPGKVHAEAPAPPPKVTPVSTSKPAEKPVQPPPFPPARPPPTEAPKEKEEEEEDDDSDEEDEADEELLPGELEQDDEHDEDDHDDSEQEQDDDVDDDEEEDADDDPEEDDDDDDRRRQAPLHDEVASPSVAPVVAPVVVSNSSAVVPAVQAEVAQNEVVPSVAPSVPAPAVDTDDESSSEEVASPPVEALVPGYITEQGEVLVPVDTVIGDQPISIVDDPSSPPQRGVPFHAHAPAYGSPYFYPNLYRESSRQGLYYNF